MTLEFFIQGVTYLHILKKESDMYSTDRREWSAIVIIRRVTVNEKSPKQAFFELKHENGIKTE